VWTGDQRGQKEEKARNVPRWGRTIRDEDVGNAVKRKLSAVSVGARGEWKVTSGYLGREGFQLGP